MLIKYNKTMTNEQIKEKYGIELILKEGWCWDSDRTKAEKCFCISKVGDVYPYECYFENYNRNFFNNFSETNPNSKEPKIGDWGWFWDNERGTYYYGVLGSIRSGDDSNFYAKLMGWWRYFSHEKPSFLP